MLNSLQNDRYSFIFTTLFVHTTNATISTKNPFFYFSQFSRSYHTVTCSQIIPTIPTNNPLLYTFAISHFHLFACNHPNNLQQKYFPISTICKVSCRYSCENWFFIPQIQKINILQVWQTIQSTVFHTLNLLSLLPYPTNTITGTQTKNQWLLLIFILSLAFSYTNHGPLHPYVWKKYPFRVK